MIETILQRVSRIPFHVLWRTHRVYLGQHQSYRHGSGLEFDQLRECQPGEGIHKINWAATARRGGIPLLVNTYYEEKDITVMLLVDLSASMDFGSARVHKRTLTAEVSASLVYSALASRDRVGLLGFTSWVECYYPPSRSQEYQRAIPEAILTEGTPRTPVDFRTVVEGFEQRVKSPALIFLCSDFLTDDEEQLAQALSRLRLRHDLIVLVVADPREQSLSAGNARVAIRDLETGERRMYSFSRKNRRLMVATGNKRRERLHHLFQKLGIAHVSITPQSNYNADITQLFRTHRWRKIE